MSLRRLIPLLFLLPLAPVAHAAESFDGCAGYIDSLPATLSKQGVWCLRKDLSTALTNGAAIWVGANNVTIDCNGFKIGGIAGGPYTQAHGISGTTLLNTTIRNCSLRGFAVGIMLDGAGHLVEDNRIDQARYLGMRVWGEHNLIQRNRLYDLGGADRAPTAIQADADIRDNTIDGMLGYSVTGIYADGRGIEVRGNRVRNLVSTPDSIHAITVPGTQSSVIDNRVINTGGTLVQGAAIYGNSAARTFCRGNLVAGYQAALVECGDLGGNVVHGPAP